MWAQRQRHTLWWLWAPARSPEEKAIAKTGYALSRLKENPTACVFPQQAYLETFSSTTPCFGTSAE